MYTTLELAKNIARRIELLVRGIFLFKDWPLWLIYRFDIKFLKRERETTFRLRNGITFKIDLSRSNPGIFQEIWLMDLYEKFYKVKNNDVVIDIGAHIGAFTVLAASKGARVYAYEPTPESFKLLKQNTKECNVSAFNLAVSKKIGEVKIFECRDGNEGNFLVQDNAASASMFTARSTTLEAIIIENRIRRCHLLKVDCEGCETLIFKHTPKKAFDRIENIAMEYHKNLSGISALLENLGYEIQGCTGGAFGYIWARRRSPGE